MTILSLNRKFLRGPSLTAVASLCIVATFILPSAIVVTARAQSPAQSSEPIEQAADETNNDEWEAGQEMEFRVIHAETKKPIAGVSLELQNAGKGIDFSDVKVQTTDAEGKSIIKLPDLAPSAVRVYPSKPGFVPLRVYWAAAPFPRMPKIITIPMHPGKAIGGTIRDDDGNPIPGVEVSIHYWGSGKGANPHVRVNICSDNFKCKGLETTDEAGRWTIDVMPEEIEAEKIYLYMKHPNYVSDSSKRGHISNPVYAKPQIEKLFDKTAVMTMRKGREVRGIVSDEAGDPISQAKIYRSHDGTRIDAPAAITEMDGEFRIGGVGDGAEGRFGNDVMSFTVEAKGYAPELIEVRDFGSPLTVTMKPGHTVKGRVIDEPGTPIEGVAIWAQNWRGQRQRIKLNAKTDADGRFRITDAPTDEVQYGIGKKGYMMVDVFPMEPGAEDYTITLPPPMWVTGSVVDAETGKPIDRFTLIEGFEYDDGRATDWQVHPRRVIRSGKYEMEYRQIGFQHRIRVEADGYMPGESKIIRPGDGIREMTFDFELRSADPIKGSVLGLDGKPLVGAKVILAASRMNINDRHKGVYDHGSRSTTTNESGQFEFQPEVEPYCLVVIHESGVGMTTEKELDSSKPITIEPWNERNQQMQIIRRPAKGQSVDFPPRN